MGGFLAEDTAAGEGLSSPHSVWEARRQEAAHPQRGGWQAWGPGLAASRGRSRGTCTTPAPWPVLGGWSLHWQKAR